MVTVGYNGRVGHMKQLPGKAKDIPDNQKGNAPSDYPAFFLFPSFHSCLLPAFIYSFYRSTIALPARVLACAPASYIASHWIAGSTNVPA